MFKNNILIKKFTYFPAWRSANAKYVTLQWRWTGWQWWGTGWQLSCTAASSIRSPPRKSFGKKRFIKRRDFNTNIGTNKHVHVHILTILRCYKMDRKLGQFLWNIKPFHVVGMIFWDVILGRKFVMIIGKQTSYWSKTGFISVCHLKK